MAEYINSHIPFESELKKRREKLNLTQEQLAIISGVSIRNIRAYEQGSIELSKAQGDTLFQLSKALNCSIEELIFVRK